MPTRRDKRCHMAWEPWTNAVVCILEIVVFMLF